MTAQTADKMVIAISSRALFGLEEIHKVFENQGEDAYTRYQVEREDEPLNPGVAVPLVLKLLGLNREAEPVRVEVILLSRNNADTGLLIFNSIRHHGLDITRAAFTRGASPYRYLLDFAPMATSKSPTYGHPKSPRQDQLNCNGVCCFNAH
jgi:5'-nucleotidase